MAELLIQLPPESVDRFYVGVDEVPNNGIAGLQRASSQAQVEQAMDRVLADDGKITWAEVDSFEKLQVDGAVAKKLAAGYARLLRKQLEYAQRKAKQELRPTAVERLVGFFSGPSPKRLTLTICHSSSRRRAFLCRRQATTRADSASSWIS